MKRSTVNQAVSRANAVFTANGWFLPPRPRWDVTDFGLGDFGQYGLVLINLAEEPEYCEKLMYAEQNQKTPAHCHARKKEDIICRWGLLAVQVWASHPETIRGEPLQAKINGEIQNLRSGQVVELAAGERITLVPSVYHEFYPLSAACIIGEVSTANDDLNDNFFVNPAIGRFSEMEEDEPPLVKLVSD